MFLRTRSCYVHTRWVRDREASHCEEEIIGKEQSFATISHHTKSMNRLYSHKPCLSHPSHPSVSRFNQKTHSCAKSREMICEIILCQKSIQLNLIQLQLNTANALFPCQCIPVCHLRRTDLCSKLDGSIHASFPLFFLLPLSFASDYCTLIVQASFVMTPK